ncbi:MAG: endolytic transglycosylase MltG [Clostridia bacterium]|nr:endolytic transglycosylase MltG [Clostridia bacterium]
MITIKKLICVLAFLSVLLTFCACTKEDSPHITAAPEETTTTKSLTVRVTFPEGLTLVQIAEKLEESEVCNASRFIALTNDMTYIQTLPYSFINEIENRQERAFILEGYIFPDTYEFYRGESEEKALSRFLDNTERKLTAEYRQRAAELGYSLDEIITLASIVQEESYTNDSVKNVSSVLHNRLRSPSFPRLQCDVTIHYVNDYITDSKFLSATDGYAEKYNTYKCEGLPVGAICNPGLASIEAALYPAETDYYYFVTDSDWDYYYASTYAEHKKNCNAVGLAG